jgi:hypothetical protein
VPVCGGVGRRVTTGTPHAARSRRCHTFLSAAGPRTGVDRGGWPTGRWAYAVSRTGQGHRRPYVEWAINSREVGAASWARKARSRGGHEIPGGSQDGSNVVGRLPTLADVRVLGHAQPQPPEIGFRKMQVACSSPSAKR